MTGLYGAQAFSSLPQVPDGYNYDFANPTVLRSGIKVENRTLVAPSGARYRVLWLDRNCEVMSLDILKKIKEFADAGVIICGKEPKGCAGLRLTTGLSPRLWMTLAFAQEECICQRA